MVKVEKFENNSVVFCRMSVETSEFLLWFCAVSCDFHWNQVCSSNFDLLGGGSSLSLSRFPIFTYEKRKNVMSFAFRNVIVWPDDLWREISDANTCWRTTWKNWRFLDNLNGRGRTGTACSKGPEQLYFCVCWRKLPSVVVMTVVMMRSTEMTSTATNDEDRWWWRRRRRREHSFKETEHTEEHDKLTKKTCSNNSSNNKYKRKHKYSSSSPSYRYYHY